MKQFLYALTLFVGFQVSAQTVENEIKKIDTPQEAEDYIDGKKRKTHRLMVFNEENHKTNMARKLLKKSVGGTEVIESQFDKTYLKVIEKTNEPHYRLRYIFLDGNKMSAKDIGLTKKIVLDHHESGLETFANLAKKYSMSTNKFKGGDTSWVKLNNLPAPLAIEDEIISHEIDEIYSVSDPENNLFYIVQKTHSVRRLKEVRVLKVIESK